jgi:hypothetical protein
MTFVSFETAKAHLRVTHDHSDADISLKLTEATEIIVRYLKAQNNAILTVSVANPTVITTATSHGLVSGTTYTVTGTTTTPTVNGPQVVTVTGPTTFTVPVNVTVGQSSAAGTVGTPVWTEATVPGAVLAAVLLVLEDLYEHRAVGWNVIERLLVGYRDPVLA